MAKNAQPTLLDDDMIAAPVGGTVHIDLMKNKPGPSKAATVKMQIPVKSEQQADAKGFGDYELGDEIARGAMGIVYRARQISLDRPVALKMMLETSFADPEDVRRFQLEAKAAGRLDHANIVPIYDVGDCNGRQYYAMRLVTGGDLGDVMADLRKDQRRAAHMVITIARAVDHAHQKGILHRDLKPANILLDAEGAPHVADFGLAKRMDDPGSLTMSGRVMGTAAYMSPEQASGDTKRVTPASDVYSLGAIFYQMLTGEPPFSGDNAMEILVKVREGEPVHPVARNPGIDRELATICLKCLEKKPDLRYASAKRLAEDLEAWLEKRPILARPPSVVRRFSRWAGRHPSMVAIVAVVLVFLGSTAGATVLVLKSHRIRLVDTAHAQVGKGQYGKARENYHLVIRDPPSPEELQEAEEGLRRLDNMEKADPGGP